MIHRKVISSKTLVLIVLVVCMEYGFVFCSGNEAVIRCIASEREALLRFKKDFIDDRGALSTWGTDDDDCCKWKGVGCSNTSGHVIALQLGDFYFLQLVGNSFSSALLELHHLEILDLNFNDFGGSKIPEFIGSMKQLQHLHLSNTKFSGIIPPQLGNLTNLRTLDLSLNDNLRSENLDWLSHLSLLSRLDLSLTNLSDTNWLQHILKLHSLEELLLAYSNIPDVMTSSSVDDDVFVNSSYVYLSVVDLRENKLSSPAIDCLFRSDHLRKLRLRGNKLKKLPAISLSEFSMLEVLDVGYNSLQDTITEANLTKLYSLKELDLSSNSLTIHISPSWTPPFQLDLLLLSGSNMGPRFPTWIQTQSNVYALDLSCNNISGEVPDWFWTSFPALQFLNLSSNHISGTIPHSISVGFSIDVSSNNFSGHIPLLPPDIGIFQLSQNMFSGSFSSICTTVLRHLEVLDLSNNQLAGELPECWANTPDLTVLSLANNGFSGEIPHTLCPLSSIQVLYLRNNNLSGELPSTLQRCKSLQLMDIGGNKLTGNIPPWMGAYPPKMTYLFLNQNRFYGSIPPEICNLIGIQVLDLSGNNLSGQIPHCFNNFTTLLHNGTTNNLFGGGLRVGLGFSSYRYFDHALVQWKGHPDSEYRENLWLLKLIDLSSNKLVGNIPETISSLKGLISLNLSRNCLTGNITPDIGQMEVLEVLDLSRNQLSGTMPISMAQLSFLAVLDLANNNLSGKIPSSTQLQSFNASAYAGNPELCGPPLGFCPRNKLSPHKEIKGGDDDGGFILMRPFFWEELEISIILGFIVGFWGLVGSLFIKRSWRIAYYNFWCRVGDWFYVTTIVVFRKLRRT